MKRLRFPLLALVLLVSGCGAPATQFGSGQALPQPVAPVAASTEQEVVVVVVTLTPEQGQPIEPELAPNAALDIGQVGEEVLRGNVALTVNSVQALESIDDQEPVSGGDTFAVVDVTLRNTGSAIVHYSASSFSELEDDDGYSYNVIFWTPEPAFSGGELAPGETIRGNIAYEVAQNKQLYFLYDASSSSTSDVAPIRISLGTFP